MVVFMSHPNHGFHFAAQSEVEYMKSHGWVIDTPPSKPAPEAEHIMPPVVVTSPEELEAYAKAQEAPKRRPGRPPKHRQAL